MKYDKETFRKLIIERDCAIDALSDVYEKIVHGIHNHMLPEVSHRRPGRDPKDKCELGHTREEVIWSCGHVCAKCDGMKKGCHAGYEELDLFHSMEKAKQVMNRKPSELPDVTPQSFKKFEPDKFFYEASPIWIARNIYNLAVGYWMFSDHGDEGMELEWRRAFDDTLSICLGVYGQEFRTLVDFVNGIHSAQEFSDKQGKFFKEHPEVAEFVEKVREHIDNGKSDDDSKLSLNDKTTLLVLDAVVLRLEYRFGHDYPGGDLDVYDGCFEGLIDRCLSIAGLYPDDAPKSYDFEDYSEYVRKKIEYNADHRQKVCEFMEDGQGLVITEKEAK